MKDYLSGPEPGRIAVHATENWWWFVDQAKAC